MRTVIGGAGFNRNHLVGRLVELRDFTFVNSVMEANLVAARASSPSVARTLTWYREGMTGGAADPDRSPDLGA